MAAGGAYPSHMADTHPAGTASPLVHHYISVFHFHFNQSRGKMQLAFARSDKFYIKYPSCLYRKIQNVSVKAENRVVATITLEVNSPSPPMFLTIT